MAAPGREDGEAGEEGEEWGDASGPAGDCGGRLAADTSGRTGCLAHLQLMGKPLESQLVAVSLLLLNKMATLI